MTTISYLASMLFLTFIFIHIYVDIYLFNSLLDPYLEMTRSVMGIASSYKHALESAHIVHNIKCTAGLSSNGSVISDALSLSIDTIKISFINI